MKIVYEVKFDERDATYRVAITEDGEEWFESHPVRFDSREVAEAYLKKAQENMDAV